jgi:hypothetical protein
MSTEGAPRFSCSLHRLAGFVLALCFVSALAFAGSPQLHERVHHDADHAGHRCAVTLLDAGKCELNDPAPLISKPQPTVQLAKLPTLTPVWVSAPFLGASIFEHAPPARS